MKRLLPAVLFAAIYMSCQPLNETRVADPEPPGEPSQDGLAIGEKPRPAPSTDQLGVYDRQTLPLRPVSVMTLLARPSDFEGSRVSVGGFFVFGFEERKLCFSEEVFRYQLVGNCIWLDLDWEALKSDQLPDEWALYKELNQWSLRYVQVVGTFAGGPQGNRDMSEGLIKSIDLVHLLEERELEVQPHPLPPV